MNLEYLTYPQDGWGYLNPQWDVIEMMQEVLDLYNPKSFLEIGFYMGHSTSMWAQILEDCEIVSCAPPHPRAMEYSPIVEQHNPNVKVHLCPSPEVYTLIQNKSFDIAFIDGNHTEDQVQLDIDMCRRLGISVLLFDNYELERVRNGIKTEIDFEPTKIWNYESNFKGKQTTNQVALFDLTNTLSV